MNGIFLILVFSVAGFGGALYLASSNNGFFFLLLFLRGFKVFEKCVELWGSKCVEIYKVDLFLHVCASDYEAEDFTFELFSKFKTLQSILTPP